MDPRIKGVIRRPRIVSVGKQASPTMPIGLNEGNIVRSVCPGFGKSTYGSSLAKTSQTILETATLKGLTRSWCLPLNFLSVTTSLFFFFLIPLAKQLCSEHFPTLYEVLII